ncbi:unnamed protein product [Triticum turgidum subsp. durum]|uniref:DUF4220 domain-containing protein n=1 Tax=Triticum turgidum subsp. durum TaxID=4567 RepID=A0A9R1NGN9_TRITD|nr:unnamed protein product [Triticum turgidum subsp. durum]
MAGGPIDFWNAWAVQSLVLTSLTLQVALVLLAGIRRRGTSWRTFRFMLWLAYQLADATAIYALGHLSFDGATPREHRLVAFWAPFLLLHLGGPDNITAYSLEDNTLWLRHLLNLGLQVLGASYVLYKHYTGTQDMLLLAVILMFVVAVVKYGERTWALKCGTMDSIRGSLKKKPPPRCQLFYLEYELPQGGSKGSVDEEFLMRHAHSLFQFCKHAIVESSEGRDPANPEIKVLDHLTHEQWYVVMELELSLLYDILYTKAGVVHTSFGYCVCIASPAAAAAALLFFQFSGKDGNSRVDVAITYILLGGALLLEIRSLLSALGSSWTLPFLCATRWNFLKHAFLCRGRWDRLRRWIVSLHRLIKVMRVSGCLRPARRWSGTVGQYNMLHLCSRPSKRSSPLPGRFAMMLGLEEWWNREHYSQTARISEDLKENLRLYIHELVREGHVSTQGIVRKKWGEYAIQWKCRKLYKKLTGDLLGVEFQEGIIIWHIATDLYLLDDKHTGMEIMEGQAMYESVRVLSNYMMFLLVERPYMLPGLAQSRLYRRTCENLVKIWGPEGQKHQAPSWRAMFRLRDGPNSRSSLQRRKKLADMVQERKPKALAKELASNGENLDREYSSLQVLLFVWMDFLVHAANRCSRESHAKKLSSGGEFTTVLWLLIEHLHQLVEPKPSSSSAQDDDEIEGTQRATVDK